MYSDTKQQILNIIKENNGTSPHSLITTLNKNASGIFRHLKKLIETSQITKVGKPPKVVYYYSANKNNMNENQTAGDKILNWATTGNTTTVQPNWTCQTRDVFQARHDRLLNELKKKFSENVAFTVAAITGEIGNNSFDHNLGNWRDVMGVVFEINLEKREIILADRGQGILASIRRVRPQTTDDADALQVAFTEVISGRFPEQRGNGLKYVAKNIKANNFSLKFYSGNSSCEIIDNQMTIKKTNQLTPGTLAIINF
ncbi:MAG: hypothetical protein A3J93_02555 [Candidatus Magasanikbacteria bacterium RIFOXYC2_FULL_42_28]|uniref:Uncharacterized protein n=1 Tax=Candidatus Magasanikbacteria bacterium RIFOXYC2_FULL_42_28 TaxID=1798704 RepID=A0A1F6NVT2_9BACT|nr:MAG: hypothetical protein A3J93_02555 [Candidatus Magasanikbacteria bacterium RIFOXYC2_FULL_42_28]